MDTYDKLAAIRAKGFDGVTCDDCGADVQMTKKWTLETDNGKPAVEIQGVCPNGHKMRRKVPLG